MSDIRPRGTVEVRCSHPDCGLCWWIDPLDPRLPNGPFDCGSTHEDDRELQVYAMTPLYGFRWGTRQYRGVRSDGKLQGDMAEGCGYGGEKEGIIAFHDRWYSKTGILDYSDISKLDDPSWIAKNIVWGTEKELFAKFGSAGGALHDRHDTPRVGGDLNEERDGRVVHTGKLIVHRCIRCEREFTISEHHPKAFDAGLTCDLEQGWAMCWGPCPAGPVAFNLDSHLVRYHGPETMWTMWEGNHRDSKAGLITSAPEFYQQGTILVSRNHSAFAVIRYKSLSEIEELAKGIKFAPFSQTDVSEFLKSDALYEKTQRWIESWESGRLRPN